MFIVSVLSGLKPGSTLSRCARLLIINPAPINSTSESATSEITSTPRTRFERCPPTAREILP